MQVLIDNAELKNLEEFIKANEAAKGVMFTQAPRIAGQPTRTTPPDTDVTTSAGAPGDSDEDRKGPFLGDNDRYETLDETTTIDPHLTLREVADEQLAMQKVITSMLDVKRVYGVRDPREVDARLAVVAVASHLISGEPEMADKWNAVYEVYKHEQGAPKTLREMQEYALAWIGSVNISSTVRTQFFDPDENSMKYVTSGGDFGNGFLKVSPHEYLVKCFSTFYVNVRTVMYGEKLQPSAFRQTVRRHYPNYEGLEWNFNRNRWKDPKDTFSVPTGMFKDNPECSDKDVTLVASMYDKLRLSMPNRRNME